MLEFFKKIFGRKNELVSEETVRINKAKSEPVKGNSAVTDTIEQNANPAEVHKPTVKTTTCKTCGKPIKYNPVQKHIPKYCSACKTAYRAAQKVTQAKQPGMVTYTCKNCGKTETIPENVQHWPDLCQECRAKLPPQTITRKCQGCGKTFLFPSNVRHWPNYCRECQAKRIKGSKRKHA